MTFEAVIGALYYQLRLFSGSNLIEMKNTSTPRYNASKLTPGQSYTVEIVSFGALGPSPKITRRFTTGIQYKNEYLRV